MLLLLSLIFSVKLAEIKIVSEFIDPSFIQTVAGINPGDEFDKEKIKNALKKLYSTQLFSQIEIDTTSSPKGVILWIKTKEYPKVTEIKIHGNRKIKTSDILKKFELKEDSILTDREIFKAKKEIMDMYKEKGFILAKVDTRLVGEEEKREKTLHIYIEEGKNVRIKDIVITGNEKIKAKAIEKKMQNKPKWWIIRKGKFDEKKFKEDIENIEKLYKNKGFLHAKVEDYELDCDTAGWLTIRIAIKEGTQYYTGNIDFKGNKVFENSSLLKLVKLKRGKPYSFKEREESITEIYTAYSEEGYIYLQLDPLEEIRKDTVDVTFQIVENNPAKVRRIIIKGNEITMENVIRREIMLLPGDRFSRSALIRSQKNIFNLGFFEDVKVDYETVDKEGNIDLTFEVKEKMAGRIQAGASYSRQDGIIGNFEIIHPNLFGRGQKIFLHLQRGSKKTQVQVGFTEPWLFGTPTTAGFDIYYITRPYELYQKKDIGITLRGEKPIILDYSRIRLILTAKNVYLDTLPAIGDTIGQYVIDPLHYPKFILSPQIEFVRDSRDYFINPSSGTYLRTSAQIAAGEAHFHKEMIEAKGYFPLFWKFVLSGNFELKFVGGYANDIVPIYERFYPGGTSFDGKIRGYPERSIGVLWRNHNLGGNIVSVFNLELKLIVNKNLAFIGFFDAGNAWESFRDMNLNDLREGIGVGIRFMLPLMGVLGFDIGYGIDRKKFEPHFHTGGAF